MHVVKYAVTVNNTKCYTINYFINGNQHDMQHCADELFCWIETDNRNKKKLQAVIHIDTV